MKEFITDDDRSRYVVHCEYGKLTELNLLNIDLPKMSTIDFDLEGNVISYDFSQLDDFLEYEFIPQYIRKEKNGPLKGKNYIALCYIIRLKLSEIELKYVLDYLSKRKIFISGFSPLLDGEFDNYDYKISYKNKDLPLPLPEGENERLIQEYRLTGNKEYHNQVIEHNMRLVRYLSIFYFYKYHIPIEELESYGNEGLILSIDSYDSSKSKFSTYVYHRISWSILDYIYKVKEKNHSSINIFSDERYVDLEKLMDIFDGDQYDHLISNIDQDIFKMLASDQMLLYDGDYSSYDEMLAHFTDIFSFYEDGSEVLSDALSDDTTSSLAINKYMQSQIQECLNSLPEKYKIVLEYIYGLNGKEHMSKAEVGRILGITREAVRQREAKALKKLRCPRVKRKLYDYLECYK